MFRRDYDLHGKRNSNTVPTEVREWAAMIRLSKDGTEYVYAADKNADPNSNPEKAIDVATRQLKEMKQLNQQVLNTKTLEKGSFMNIAGIFASVGRIMLDKCNAGIGKIVFRDKRNKPNFIAIASNDKEDIKKLIKLTEELERERE